MKLIKIIILILTVSTTFAAICNVITENAFAPNKVCNSISIEPIKHVYPEDSQLESEANALKQNTSARKLIYKPGKKVKEILKNSATYLLETLETFNEEVKKLIYMADISDGGVNRQVDFGGSLSTLAATNPSLTGKQGVTDMLKAHKAGTATVIQTIGFVSFLGDIGAQVNDCFARNKTADKIVKVATEVKEKFPTFDVKVKMNEETFKARKVDTFYPNKSKERFTCMVMDGEKCDLYSHPRSGVLNQGSVADDKMGYNGEKIPTILWPLQTILKTTVASCPKEPWAGLYSGSINELLFMLDLLTKSDPNDTKGADRRAKAAIASALLIATGFHSAIEVVHVVKLYLGEESKYDSCIDATDYISKLIDEFNSETDKVKKKKLKMKKLK